MECSAEASFWRAKSQAVELADLKMTEVQSAIWQFLLERCAGGPA